jgi:hypothetical protein
MAKIKVLSEYGADFLAQDSQQRIPAVILRDSYASTGEPSDPGEFEEMSRLLRRNKRKGSPWEKATRLADGHSVCT